MKPAASQELTVLRGTIVTCRDDPFLTDPARAFATEADGVVVCRDGMVESVGPAAEIDRAVQVEGQ